MRLRAEMREGKGGRKNEDFERETTEKKLAGFIVRDSGWKCGS